MQKREKILGGVLAGLFLCYFALPMIQRVLFQPLTDLTNQETALTESLATKEKQQLAHFRKVGQLKNWRAGSLPKEPTNAQRLYEVFLSNLAQMSGIKNATFKYETLQRGPIMTPVPVTLEGTATMENLALFLERFHSIDLLQRIRKCNAITTSHEGNPEVSITITAEGVAMNSAEDRALLFPQSELSAPLAADGTQLTVNYADDFPEEAPFRVHIDGELLNVTELDGNVWKVERGTDRTISQKHEQSAIVEYYPRKEDESGREEQLVALWTNNVFVKPGPEVNYQPRLANETPPPALRGQTWTFPLEILSWNPAFGTPRYTISEGPDGLEVDAVNGTLVWNVPADQEKQTYDVKLGVTEANGREARFEPQLQVRVRDPNQAPVIEKMQSLSFYIGRESRVKIPASDPDDAQAELEYSLEEGPEGMTIDRRTGDLRWTPQFNLAPREFQITVGVKDQDEMALTTTTQIPVALKEDSARFAYLTGFIERTNGNATESFAWIYDRITGKNREVHVGDQFEIADLDLTVVSINTDHLILRKDDELYRFDADKPLAQMTPVAPRPADESGSQQMPPAKSIPLGTSSEEGGTGAPDGASPATAQEDGSQPADGTVNVSAEAENPEATPQPSAQPVPGGDASGSPPAASPTPQPMEPSVETAPTVQPGAAQPGP